MWTILVQSKYPQAPPLLKLAKLLNFGIILHNTNFMERLPKITIPNRITFDRPSGKKSLIGVENEFLPPKVFEFTNIHPPVISRRQKEIVQLIIEGTTFDRQIALKLGITLSTVQNHIQKTRVNLEKRGHDLLNPKNKTLKIKIILALMQEGELILRDPQ